MEDKNRLHILIDAYFNGELTVGEERALRRKLLQMKGSDPKIDEALAVMSYGLSMPRSVESEGACDSKGFRMLRAYTAKKNRIRYSVSAAAVLLMVGGIGLGRLFDRGRVQGDECLAYVNGVEVRNMEKIQSLITSQLSEMGDASQDLDAEMKHDLDDIREALKFE